MVTVVSWDSTMIDIPKCLICGQFVSLETCTISSSRELVAIPLGIEEEWWYTCHHCVHKESL